ncbi:hypothetical protein SLE2022_018160 [Rubroshorea leprosula]
MEVKEGCRKNQGPPLSPHLLYMDGEKMALFSITQIGGEKDVKTTPPELRGKKVITSFHGWLILHDVDVDVDEKEEYNADVDEKEEYNADVDEEEEYYHYSLWNPLTLEFICLPAFHLKPEQELRECILTSPPGNDDSMLLFFEKKVPSFIFYRIGDEHWTHQPITADFETHYLTNFVVCNGTLYCSTDKRGNMVRIDTSASDRHLLLVLFDASRPEPREVAVCNFLYRAESFGELFEIHVLLEGTLWNKVHALEVFRLDFSSMEWRRVESFEDRAFFLVGRSFFSCQAIGSGVKGNHVYFTLSEDRSLYSFNMEDKTVSVALPCSNLSICCEPILLLPDLRNDNIESKNNDLDVGRKVIKSEERQVVKRPPPTEAEAETAMGDFGKLPLDMVFEIGRCLILGDYMNFRAVNKMCHLAAPSIQWRRVGLKGFTDYNCLPPWFTSFKKGDAICNFFSPFRAENYFVSIPNNELKDAKMCYSRDGWCLMLRGQSSLFLWNPIVEGIFVLPDLLCKWNQVVGCSISSFIDSVVLIRDDFSIDFIFLEESEWSSFSISGSCDHYFWVSIPAFYEGAFYFFFEDGNLAIFKIEEEPFFQILNQLKAPCSFHQIFLLQCDGMLLSVLVGFLGEWILVFKLDFSKMAWVEVENLGKNTLFISRFSSFSMRAPSPEMENRIYFPRFYEKDGNIIYYSLSTGKLHSHGTEEVLENFYNTKEKLSSNWIEPSWNWDVYNGS